MPVTRFYRAPPQQSPLPPDPPPVTAALTLDELKLALRIDGDSSDSQLTRNLEAARALTERQAPGAPTAIKAEAMIRAIGWLHDGIDLPDASVTSVWTRSGARALLSAWTARRAGLA